MSRVCNAPSKFGGFSLNDNIFTGPDLLLKLMELIFRFPEQKITINADSETLCLQKLQLEDCLVLRVFYGEKII